MSERVYTMTVTAWVQTSEDPVGELADMLYGAGGNLLAMVAENAGSVPLPVAETYRRQPGDITVTIKEAPDGREEPGA